MAGQSPRPLACNEDENSADGNEAVLEGGHGQDGELSSILQWKDSKQPPTPGGTTGTGLQEIKYTYGVRKQGFKRAGCPSGIFLEHLHIFGFTVFMARCFFCSIRVILETVWNC